MTKYTAIAVRYRYDMVDAHYLYDSSSNVIDLYRRIIKSTATDEVWIFVEDESFTYIRATNFPSHYVLEDLLSNIRNNAIIHLENKK